MSGSVSLDLSIYIDRESDDCPIFLFELTHPDYAGVMRLCSSDVTRLGASASGMPIYGVRSNLGRAGQRKRILFFAHEFNAAFAGAGGRAHSEHDCVSQQ